MKNNIFRTNLFFEKYLLHLGLFMICIIKIKNPLVIYGRIFVYYKSGKGYYLSKFFIVSIKNFSYSALSLWNLFFNAFALNAG